MRIGSLFSGIGGLELGLEWAGVGHTAWQVEYDPFCRGELAKLWPDVQRFTDVREVGAHNLEPVDVICGGYPCQPFSTAGRREGDADPRHLWPEFARILRDLRPRYAVLENVPGHLSLGFGEVLGDLSEIGYDAEWSVVSAASVGADHERERVFVIAYPAGERQPEPWDYREGGGDRAPSPDWEASGLVDAVRRGALPFLCREDHGIPNAMDRLRALGNAVVPHVAQVVGRRLLAIQEALL